MESINGTYLQGYVNADYDTLVEKLGQPDVLDGYKTQCQWVIRGNHGVIATLYDWKQASKPEDIRRWNIGGHHRGALGVIERALSVRTIPA